MSRSKKWRLEWAFFLGENGRRKYNKVCKGCVHPLQAEFSGGSYLLSPLPVRTLEKVRR